MSGRTLFAFLTAIAAVAFVALVVLPGVQRGGWLEVAGVVVVIAGIALFDRAWRRFSRRRG